MSRWISVNEKMPPPLKSVLVCQRYTRNSICVQLVGKWIPELTEEANDDCDDWHTYDEASDAYYVPEGWYENQQNWGEFASIHIPFDEVTHWMPLPEPPE